jgi:hypothetical protein
MYIVYKWYNSDKIVISGFKNYDDACAFARVMTQQSGTVYTIEYEPKYEHTSILC